MADPRTRSTKTCFRCGRTGSHAFRRTPEGLDECSTPTACRTRQRRTAGRGADGRGRLPARPGPAAIGVAYVVGTPGAPRHLVEAAMREETQLAVTVGDPTRATLSALGLRNVRMIAVEAGCLRRIGFRNEFELRRRQPQLREATLVVYGTDRDVAQVAPHPGTAEVVSFTHRVEEMRPALHQLLRPAAEGVTERDAD